MCYVLLSFGFLLAQIVSSFGRIVHYALSFTAYFCSIKNSKYSNTNWLVVANTTGATGGKMISPQSIAIATAACNMQGRDGEILRAALPYALAYIAIGGLMVLLAV